MKHKRGKLLVDFKLFRSNEKLEQLSQMFELLGFVPTEISMIKVFAHPIPYKVYTGHSRLFREIAEGDAIPEYTLHTKFVGDVLSQMEVREAQNRETSKPFIQLGFPDRPPVTKPSNVVVFPTKPGERKT